jgi:hypothetical protein
MREGKSTFSLLEHQIRSGEINPMTAKFTRKQGGSEGGRTEGGTKGSGAKWRRQLTGARAHWGEKNPCSAARARRRKEGGREERERGGAGATTKISCAVPRWAELWQPRRTPQGRHPLDLRQSFKK